MDLGVISSIPFPLSSSLHPLLTLGLWVVRTNSRTGSSTVQLLGRQRSDIPEHREQGKPPSPERCERIAVSLANGHEWH